MITGSHVCDLILSRIYDKQHEVGLVYTSPSYENRYLLDVCKKYINKSTCAAYLLIIAIVPRLSLRSTLRGTKYHCCTLLAR